MSVLSLKELDSKCAEDHGLLDLFQKCRENVLMVHTCPWIPDYLVITTRCGFIQAVNTVAGTFRLFLTFLDQIPLDTALKCFALAPSFFASTGHPMILYSLSYSNELLVADLTSGEIDVFGSFTSRPFCVQNEGDYVVCGESNGTVHVWRCVKSEKKPPLLWSSPIFDDSVTYVTVSGDSVVCCSADYSCTIVSAENGTRLITLDIGPGAVKQVVEVCSERNMLFCLPHKLVLVHREGQKWSSVGGVPLEDPVQSITVHGDLVVTGTASGVVQLYRFDNNTNDLTQLNQFDVGYGVVALQAYNDSSIVVVTTAGDVWRWPIPQLLPSTDPEDEEVAEEEEEVVPLREQPPVPAQPPEEHYSSDFTSITEEVEEKESSQGVMGDEKGSYNVPSPSVGTSSSTSDRSETIDVEPSTKAALVEPLRVQDIKEALDKDTVGNGEPVVEDGEFSADEDTSIHIQDATLPPEEDSKTESRHSSLDDTTLQETTTAAPTPPLYSEREDELVYALSKKIGHIPEITGLRHGPRMDPREIVSLLTQHIENHEAPREPVPGEGCSSEFLLELKEKMLASDFDFEEYAKTHALEMEALMFKEPVRLPSYKLKDRVFENVTAMVQEKGGEMGKFITGKENGRMNDMEVARDEYADVTVSRFRRKRDPEMEEELRRAGPNIFSHSCDSMMFTVPSCSSHLLFNESALKPVSRPVVVLPLPISTTPSPF